MSTTEQLLTAQEYFQLSDKPERSELVRGVIVPMNPPGLRHGFVCFRVGYLLGLYLDEHDVGQAFSNDSGIVTQRDPDTVRGGDISFYSYDRLPGGELPVGYAESCPNVVFEVRSPSDRWSEIHEKIAEYLAAGVETVCVFVPETASVHLFYPDRPGEILGGDQPLALPAPLEEFRQPVSAFFARR